MYQLVTLRPWAIQLAIVQALCGTKSSTLIKHDPKTRAIFQGKLRFKPNYERKSASASIKNPTTIARVMALFQISKTVSSFNKESKHFEVNFSESSQGIKDQFSHIFHRTMFMLEGFDGVARMIGCLRIRAECPRAVTGNFPYLSPNTFEPSNFVGHTATLSELVHM